MHVLLTDDEKDWVDMSVYGWQIKKGCPKNIKIKIQKFFEQLEKQGEIIDGDGI